MATRRSSPPSSHQRYGGTTSTTDPGPHADAADPQPAPVDQRRSRATMELSVADGLAQVTPVRKEVCAFAERHDVARPDDVALAVGEAIANVVTHAYRGRATGPLHVTGLIDSGLIYVTVADEGSGLQPRLDSPGLGLGLALIARVSDHFHISHRQPAGTLVSMGFERSIPPDPDDDDEGEQLERARERLAAAIYDGADQDTVDALVERAALGAEARDALWLYAWATAELAQRRHGQGGSP